MVDPVLSLAGIEKVWPNGTAALRGVDMVVRPGAVHGLLGANGAGKSTLIKVLSGAIAPTSGSMIWHGEPVTWSGPRAARSRGVATVYQHIPLVPTLSARENMLLELRGLWRDDASSRSSVEAVLSALGNPFDPNVRVGDMTVGERQMVAIAQSLIGNPSLVVMDEPTASLAASEREEVYRAVQRLKGEGRSVLFVSHFIDEIVSLTDNVTVLRDGKVVLDAETSSLDARGIAEAIAGRSVVALEQTHRAGKAAETILELRDLRSPGRLSPVNLTLAKGEIVGVAGLLGSGRSELLHAIFGADPGALGEVRVGGCLVTHGTDAAVAAGLALVPEDRAKQGLLPEMTIADNIALPRSGFLIDRDVEHHIAEETIRELAIKARGAGDLVSDLSGGNAQKVVIGKWLTSDTRVLLLDEPTAGIDIGARTDILRLVRSLADDGLSVILVTSEFEELLAIADRIIVMRDKRIVAEVEPGDADVASLIRTASETRKSMERA